MKAVTSMLVALCFAALPVRGQDATSPMGFARIAGDSGQELFGPGAPQRFQQVDASRTGAGAVTVRSIGFRRDDAGGGSDARARSFDLTVRLGHADMARLSAAFDDNFAGGADTVVRTRRIDLPDWRAAAGQPAAFDCIVLFDRPFVHDGVRALVIDFTTANVVVAGGGGGVVAGGGGTAVTADAVLVPPLVELGRAIGTGCTAWGQNGPFAHTMRIENQGPAAPDFSMRMQVGGARAPAGAAVLLNIDTDGRDLTLPGLCAAVRAVPIHQIALGVADRDGALDECAITCPHIPHLVGIEFATQLTALDSSQAPIPVVLSNGAMATMYANPNPRAVECAFHTAAPVALSAPLRFGGGVVLRLGL